MRKYLTGYGSQITYANWFSCIDGALTKEHYLDSIRKAGFSDTEVLEEKLYMEGDNVEGRRITSLVIKAVKA